MERTTASPTNALSAAWTGIESRSGAQRRPADLVWATLGALIACEASAGDPWDRFLQHPDASSFAELSQKVDGRQCGWGKPANKEMVPDRVRGPLFDLIANGNEGAFQIGLSSLRCFDGGDLEDFYRAAGEFMEQQPKLFLRNVTDRKVPRSDVASMASSVPTNDDPDAALKKVGKRIALLRDLTDGNVADAQAASMSALQKREADLKRLKASVQ
jgi:hypothetical protein